MRYLCWPGSSRPPGAKPVVPAMSKLVNRNVQGAGTRISMRLEPEMWDAFRDICVREEISGEELVKRALLSRPNAGRTSAVRVFILMYYRVASRIAQPATSIKAVAHQTNDRPIEIEQFKGWLN
jgi:predicted DNA-binding ribbon-helix-helix protein